MGRHAAPGPPDRPASEHPDAQAQAQAPERPVSREPEAPSADGRTPPAPSEPQVQHATAPAEPSAPERPASPGTAISLLASLVLGTVVGLTAGGVLWWAGQPLVVAGAVAGGTALVVVLAAWVARGVAARHPLQ